MLSELKKENILFREYIATLEQQVKANAEERKVLCQQLNNLDVENNSLDRRISQQSSMIISEVALQHLQEKLNQLQNQKRQLQNQLKQALQKNGSLSCLIQLKQKQNIELSFKITEIPLLKSELYKIHATLKQKDNLIQTLKNELKQQKEQRAKLQPVIGAKIDLEKRNNEHLVTIQEHKNEIRELKIALSAFKQRNQILIQYEQHLQESKKQNILLTDKIANLSIQNSIFQITIDSLKKQFQKQREQFRINIQNLQVEKNLLQKQLDKEFNEKQQIKRQKQSVVELLKVKKQQFEELIRSKKKQDDNKARLSSKNYRSNCFSKTQGDFSNTFAELKNQIQNLKLGGDDQIESTKRKQLQKEEQKLQLNSPKWRSIQNKLFILRSTNSNGRFK